ncbi:hypothetical protein E2320_010128 [Naja naja]|nr:hypothetical protein E2320_010128 [Naja naja]
MRPAEDSELDGRIRCTVAVEHLGAAAAPNRRLLRDAWVTLGRNEFRELVLQLNPVGSVGSDCVQLLLSNCPPDRLRRFVQTLRIKFEATQQGRRPVAERTRLLSSLPRTFDTVSPVQARDLQQENARGALANVTATPTKGQALRCGSRKRPMESVEGRQTTEEKQVKKPWLMGSRATLSQEQSRVLNAVLSGKNVFFTGSAGTGKSYLLKKIVASFPPNGTYVTASTGVAACQIGGITLHAFAGIGSGKAPLHQCLELAQRPGVRQQWLNCRCLIIDEISMVDGELFDKLEAWLEEVTRLLTQTVMQKVERNGILATRLCTHKDDVEFTNTTQLQQLSGQLRSFKAVDSDPMLAKTLDAQCPVKSMIELKEGAQVNKQKSTASDRGVVMLTKNLVVSQGLVNGARGVVIGFEAEGKDCAEVSLARVFESGQAYVALSRARSLASLRVLDFEAKASLHSYIHADKENEIVKGTFTS